MLPVCFINNIVVYMELYYYYPFTYAWNKASCLIKRDLT